MKLKNIIYLLFIFFWQTNTFFAQKFADKNYYLVDSLDLNILTKDDRLIVDSCLKLFYVKKSDTAKTTVLIALIEATSDINVWPKYNRWLFYFTQKKISEHPSPAVTKKMKSVLADVFNNFGFLYYNRGEITVALEYFHKALKMREEIGDKAGSAVYYNNIGAIYDKQGDIPKSLECYQKSLKLYEQLGQKKGMAYSYNNIASNYSNQKDHRSALEYHYKSLKLREEINDRQGIAGSYFGIGSDYQNMQEFPLALEFLNKSLKINEQLNNMFEMAYCYNNIGVIYRTQKNPEKALIFLTKSLEISDKIGDKYGIASSLYSIGNIKLEAGNIDEAWKYGKRGLDISKELGFPGIIESNARFLSNIAQKKGNWKDAFLLRELALRMHDSLANEANIKATFKQQAKFEYEKNKAINDKEHEKELAVSAKQKEKQLVYTYAAVIGLVLTLAFLFFAFNRLSLSRKQNLIIERQRAESEHQRERIEEVHKEITDSINYAERIQRSFLASEDFLNENLNNHFVFFKPKDVVSGDFYWAQTLNNGNFVYVTADSTGHGVPGSIMSILNISSLEKAVEKEHEPAAILNTTRKLIIDRLKKDGSPDGGKDGMDCSLVVIDKNKKQLHYTAANNPVWIVRENNLLEFAPDKMPVGKHDNDHINFTQHTIQLQPGDSIYTFTDGFPDQFGGPKAKKYMYKKFKELFISVSQLSMQQQKETISKVFDDWKGNLEQVDDVCIIGVRL